MTLIAEAYVAAPHVRKRNKRTGEMRGVPTLLNVNHRLHQAQKAKITALWRTAGRNAAALESLPKLEERVFVEAWVHLSKNFTFDAQNFYPSAKAAIDGMVADYGMLPDDSNAWLVGPLCLPGVKKPEMPGIHLRVHRLGVGSMYPDANGYGKYGMMQA